MSNEDWMLIRHWLMGANVAFCISGAATKEITLLYFGIGALAIAEAIKFFKL